MAKTSQPKPRLPHGAIETELHRILQNPAGIASAALLEPRLPKLREHLTDREWNPAELGFAKALRTLISDLIDGAVQVVDSRVDPDAMSTALRIDFGLQEVLDHNGRKRALGSKGRTDAAASSLGLEHSAYCRDRRDQPTASRRTFALRNMVHIIDPIEQPEPTSPATPAPNIPAGPKPSPVRPPSRPASPIGDVREAYYRPSLEDFELGFWWRPSTELYISALAHRAQVAPVTLYAGADGSSDVGPLLHKDILTTVLIGLIRNDSLFGNIPSDARRKETAERIARGVADVCGTPYLGSVVRELCRTLTRHGYTSEGSEDALTAAIQEAIVAPRTTSGQVAYTIALLAFVLRHAGVEARVLNAYHDQDLTTVESEVRSENPSLRPYRFHSYDKLTWPADPGATEIPLIPMVARPHVSPTGSVVIGELESIEDEEPHPSSAAASSVLARALEETTVLFVGTSLTDPGVIATLARTRHFDVPRYAIMLPPDLALTDKSEWSLARALLAQRYLHLGVVPILADFPHQVPQFLREVAFKVHSKRAATSYAAYRRRLRDWWDHFGSLFGRVPNSPPTDPDGLEYQASWGPTLETIRGTIGAALKEAAPRWGIGGRADAIIIELWIRNPKGRCLFKWASTDGDDAQIDREVVLLIDPRGISDVARAFRDGIATKPPSTEDGECSVSVPLVLHKAPWHHLPVGVVRLRSDRANGAFQYCASHASEMRLIARHVQTGIEPWLDPILRTTGAGSVERDPV